MKNPLSYLILLFLLFTSFASSTQTNHFKIEIEAVSIEGLGGLQSYAFGQHDGKWLIIGGRLDGLHRRQPFASFDLAGHNDQIFVVDPINGTTWKRTVNDLPVSIAEQLRSTNMQFYQEGDHLIIVGGYGYSSIENDHTTFDKMTIIELPALIDAIIQEAPIQGYIQQFSDEYFAITGGRLEKISDTFYLVGGQKFIGRYNPMGPDHGPGFIQEYTDQIRRFTLSFEGLTPMITKLESWTDPEHLHRRDYNVIPSILRDGSEAMTAFSGVFRQDVDLPFLNPVHIDESGYKIDQSFEQLYNHYHCAFIPLYSEATGQMHNIFFGGMAQFYQTDGMIIQDDNVPFVTTIAKVSRNAEGQMTEEKLAIEMPGYFGSGSEFIPNSNLASYANNVIKLDKISSDSILLGYIFGGIESSAKNIFFSNNGTQSDATERIFKVYLSENALLSSDFDETKVILSSFEIIPNPNTGDFSVSFNISESTEISISIRDQKGRKVHQTKSKFYQQGPHKTELSIDKRLDAGTYIVIIQSDQDIISKQMILLDSDID